MPVLPPRIGDVVRIRLHWAVQSRFKCARCSRYMRPPACSSCGATYEHVSGDFYLLTAA